MPRLVLTRRVGEAIELGDDIRIEVAHIRGESWVHVGIEAPAGTQVLRAELLERDPVRRRKPRHEPD